MELYIDTANLSHIRECASYGFISGVTTNPSLLAKEDPKKDVKDIIKEIYATVGGHLSVEVNSLKADEMLREADDILSWFPEATIKIPMLPSGLGAVSELAKRGIPTNVTLVFSPTQAIAANNAGATYVSVFMGRLDDIGMNSSDVLDDICEIWNVNEYDSSIIAASIRHPMHLLDAARSGAHISTVPYNVLMQSLKHPLTDSGVAAFVADYEKMKAAKAGK